jgi:threonine aldolase
LIGLRFVTHLDVDAAGIDHTVNCIHQFFREQAIEPAATSATGAGVY